MMLSFSSTNRLMQRRSNQRFLKSTEFTEILATACRSCGLFVNLQRFRRRARTQAFSFARAVRY